MRVLAERGISKLNAFQELAIPVIFEGRDALLIAATAGGKTEAAVLPLLEKAAASNGSGVSIIYVAPLRALLNDIEPRIRNYAEALRLRTFKGHGDVSAKEKRQAEVHPPDILLITPESIEVILTLGRSPDALFRNLQAVLIDEVHYFAESGRGAQLISQIGRLEAIAGHPLQRVGLSATVGNPGTILDWLKRPASEGRIVAPENDGGWEERVWEVLATREGELARQLLPLLAKPIKADGQAMKAPRSIVFCRSRKATEDISRKLERESKQHPGIRFEYGVHHSSVGKEWRERAEREIKLRDMASRTVIATSSLELGIDLGDLDLVGQAGAMSRVSSFLQRVGRAGRRHPKRQWFVSVNVRPSAQDEDDGATWSYLKNLAILNLGGRGIVEAVEPVQKAYHILAQQILAMSVCNFGFRVDADLSTLLNARPFKDIDRMEAENLVSYMIENDILRSVPPNLLIGQKGEKLFLRQNGLPLFSVFDTPNDFSVLDGKSEVGVVNAIYVLGRELPFDIRLAGRNWRATSVSVERGIVQVEQTSEGVPPHWMSTGPGTSRLIVEEMARIAFGAPLEDHIRLRTRAAEWLQDIRRVPPLPIIDPLRIHVRQVGDSICRVEALGGDRVMQTIALWLEAEGDLVTKDIGPTALVVRKSGDEVLDANYVTASLKSLMASDRESILKTLSEVVPDNPRFNKFAVCVPPDLRQLHIASTIATPTEVVLFQC